MKSKRCNIINFSPLYFGAMAFLTKPGQSIAPMIGWFIFHFWSMDISKFSGNEVLTSPPNDIPFQLTFSTLGGVTSFNYDQSILFQTIVFIPFTCAIIQLTLWSLCFNLKDSKLKKIKLGQTRLFQV